MEGHPILTPLSCDHQVSSTHVFTVEYYSSIKIGTKTTTKIKTMNTRMRKNQKMKTTQKNKDNPKMKTTPKMRMSSKMKTKKILFCGWSEVTLQNIITYSHGICHFALSLYYLFFCHFTQLQSAYKRFVPISDILWM